jgi:hypothetical protein
MDGLAYVYSYSVAKQGSEAAWARECKYQWTEKSRSMYEFHASAIQILEASSSKVLAADP